jgi:hypothetical protein
MVLAYENGAKYINIFDSDQNYTQNVLQQGQLDAMKQFWQYVQANPRNISQVSDRTAYVLPKDYGYGFRGPQDKIWGLWPNDSLTLNILNGVATLMQKYGNNLDIVYPDGTQSVESAGYQNVIYWNDTTLIANISATPSPQSQKNTSLPFYATTVSLYAIAASIIVAVAITGLKFRKRNGNFDQKSHFPK